MDPVAFIESVTTGENLADMLAEDVLSEIAHQVQDSYTEDKASMADWLARMGKAIDLAKLVKDDKSYPFANASNIKYPLVTTAALQFNARAYPAIVPGEGLVKCKTWGRDQDGKKAARGERVAEYMSYQILKKFDEWESDTDRLTLQLPIVGDMFRKVWDNGKRAEGKLAEPGAVILNANAKTLQQAPQITEEFCLYPHEIESKVRRGWFTDVTYDEDCPDAQEFLEQSMRYDLDDDGYAEPYICTYHKDSQKIVRMVADFTPDDVEFKTEMQTFERPVEQVVADQFGMPMRVMAMAQEQREVPVGVIEIKRGQYWVHYQFMPGFGNGLLGTGLGLLLGDIAEGINSAFNQLFDAGHYASLGGGFIGSEFRLKGGNQRMRPGEWRTTSAQGQDIRSAIVPLTYPGADQTMFALLGMLIDAGKEVSSTKDIMTGDAGGKTQTATTTLALIEQGMKVFTACYKRLYRGLEAEFTLIGKINATRVDPQEYQTFLDEQADPAQDFAASDMDIQPVADPEAVTKMQDMARAQVVRELASEGKLRDDVATLRVLEAAGIPNAEELIPPQNPMQEQMMKMQMQSAQADLAAKSVGIELTMAQVQETKAKAMATVADVDREAEAQRFDGMMRVLEIQRDDLARTIQDGLGGMANAPGNGSNRPMPRILAGPAQAAPVGIVPGGQAGFGG